MKSGFNNTVTSNLQEIVHKGTNIGKNVAFYCCFYPPILKTLLNKKAVARATA